MTDEDVSPLDIPGPLPHDLRRQRNAPADNHDDMSPTTSRPLQPDNDADHPDDDAVGSAAARPHERQPAVSELGGRCGSDSSRTRLPSRAGSASVG
jgi:hypothetical protein